MRVRPGWSRWDHNAHFHRWLLRRLPGHLDRALDVGCGAGRFARLLAARARQVDAVEESAAMVEAAAGTPGGERVTWVAGDVLVVDLPEASYDVVTAIASLHHLPLERGLVRLGSLVRPGGTLAVVGLSRPHSWRDLRLDALSMVLDPLVGATRAARHPGRPRDPVPPLRDAAETFEEIAEAARRLLPGVRLRRHLFYRYTLTWVRPRA